MVGRFEGKPDTTGQQENIFGQKNRFVRKTVGFSVRFLAFQSNTLLENYLLRKANCQKW